jgi:hypothetical protein
MSCFHFYKPPLINDPPTVLLPDPSVAPAWYGEVWVKYPSTDRIFPVNHGHAFKAICDFRVIQNEIGARSFGLTNPIRSLHLEEAENFRLRLEDWYRYLPDPVSAKTIIFPNQLKLQ